MGMKDTLSFSELRDAMSARAEDLTGCEDWTIADWGNAMAGECGEACNVVKKMRRGDNIDTSVLAHELADVVCYADRLAYVLGIDLGAAVREKFNIVSVRRSSAVRL